MKIAWCITGAGQFLKESFEVFKAIKTEKLETELKVTIFISNAGLEVLRMYGIFDKLNAISNGDYMEEIFTEKEQGSSFPKTGRFSLKKYDAVVVSPATSNTVAKIAYGIADSLVTNVVSLAMKACIPVYIVPTDGTPGKVDSEIPYSIDRDKCRGCDDCEPEDRCEREAIYGSPIPQIDLLRCDGCGLCSELCPYDAISGGVVEIKAREIDIRNVELLREMEGISIIEHQNLKEKILSLDLYHNSMYKIPETHPRYESLMKREKLVEGIEAGITSKHGLIAHGRGEAFDYLIGERTLDSARRATEFAAALLLAAKKPVISVNGNVAALAAKEIVELSELINAPLEVNIFYRSEERVRKIKEHLEKQGARKVLGDKADVKIPGIEHARAMVDREGIYSADVVLAPLEDGDRCEALVDMGKKVITIDLNPLSRTSRHATVSIVDDVERALKNLISAVKAKKQKEGEGRSVSAWEGYNNKGNLREAIKEIMDRLKEKGLI